MVVKAIKGLPELLLASVVATIVAVVPAGAGDLLCSDYAKASKARTFKTVGSMTSARSLHTATLLSDGRVLVVGGVGAGVESPPVLGTAELYSPTNNKFKATTSMSTPRLAAAAVRLRDGRVLVVGGENSSHIGVNSAEIYNPRTGRWALTSPMNYARLNPTATLLKSGKVLVVGGYSVDSYCCALSSAELFDPKTGTFSTTGFMAVARRNHTATLLKDGRVLIAGGYNGLDGNIDGTGNVNAPEVYDPVTGTFDSTGIMSSARRFPTATMLLNGKVLIAGGYDGTNTALSSVDSYNSRRRSFVSEGSMQVPRGRHTATLLTNGKLLIAGGYDGAGTAFASAELYNPAAGTFSSTGLMATARWRHEATRLSDGNVLITGGSDGTTSVSSAEVYHAHTNHPARKTCRGSD
jgi:deoxycytidylate deaminase